SLANLRPLGPLVRRPRPARLHLPRELVDLARHLDHRQDDPRGGHATRSVLGHVGVVAVGERAEESPAEAAREGIRPSRLRALALVAATAVVCGAAGWLISPRFSIDTPSLVDDWAAISRSPHQVGQLVRLHNPEQQRFRPSWILWNEVQWHTFDAPN